MLLHLGTEELVPDLHLHNGLAQWAHGSLDVQVPALKGQPTASGFLPHKSHLLLVVIHLLVQALIALFALLVDSQGKRVLVHVMVEWHREHYSECFISSVSFPLKQIVGQHAHRTRGFAFAFAEVAHFSLLWAHSRLGGAVAVATFQENPFLTATRTRKKKKRNCQNWIFVKQYLQHIETSVCAFGLT